MRRRAPNENVEPFRHRYHSEQAKPIKEFLVEWCAEHEPHITGAEPEMPKGIEDRAADCWEPLLAIADRACTDWPQRAREAAVYLTLKAADESLTKGVELLAHIRDAFGSDGHLATAILLERLRDRDESPWKDIRGKPLDDRGLAARLKPYAIKSKVVRIGDRTPRGYAAEDFHDAWDRYLPPYMDVCNKPNKRNIFDNENNFVADVVDVAEGMAGGGVSADDLKHACLCKACDGLGCPTCQPERFGLHPKSKIGDGDSFAILKDESLIPDLPAFLDRRLRA